MGQETSHRGSQEDIIVFPAVPWLVDGNQFESYLESCLSHLKAQECTDAELLPPFLTEPINKPFTRQEQMGYVTPKLNEIIEEFLKTDATHLWFLNADNEVPPDALCKLLELDVDVASGVSPPHTFINMSTAMYWMPPPSPEFAWSKPYYKAHKMSEIRGRIIGGDRKIATGHFCLLCKRHVFDKLRFKYDPPQIFGSEITFWDEAQDLGYLCRIHGGVICGHLPEFPIEVIQRRFNG